MYKIPFTNKYQYQYYNVNTDNKNSTRLIIIIIIIIRQRVVEKRKYWYERLRVEDMKTVESCSRVSAADKRPCHVTPR